MGAGPIGAAGAMYTWVAPAVLPATLQLTGMVIPAEAPPDLMLMTAVPVCLVGVFKVAVAEPSWVCVTAVIMPNVVEKSTSVPSATLRPLASRTVTVMFSALAQVEDEGEVGVVMPAAGPGQTTKIV